MLASGLGVYRFVMIGQISREQHQLVRPAPPLCGGGEGNKDDRSPNFTWVLFCAILSPCGVVFTLTDPVTQLQQSQELFVSSRTTFLE